MGGPEMIFRFSGVSRPASNLGGEPMNLRLPRLFRDV
jgi:hypothetical protein